MKHFMHLKEAPFGQIWNGSKTIELRLYDEKRRKIRVGDIIEFEDMSGSGRRIVTNVIALHVFESFEALYEALPLEKCGYDRDSISKASASDMKLYYSSDEQAVYGVVGIEFEVTEMRKQ